MTGLTRKRSTWVALVVVIALSSITILTQFDGRTSSSVGPSSTSSSTTSSVSTSSLAQQKSASTSSSNERIYVGFSQTYSSLFATPSATLNYTITLSQPGTTGGHVILSAVSIVPGVTLSLNPNEFTFLGAQEAVVLGISVAPTVNASILPVEITASTAKGASNSSLDFRLNKALVVMSEANTGLTPLTLNVSVGQTVTWLDLVVLNDDGDGYVNVMFTDGSAASPLMAQNDVWAHVFDKPGTYTYQVVALGYWSSSGTVVVS